MNIVYQEIGELAQIFNVQDRGEKLIAELKAREDAARKRSVPQMESFQLLPGSPAHRLMQILMSPVSSALLPISFLRSASGM